jgi:DNA invertase Pin-like site-specific DNA recombinase
MTDKSIPQQNKVNQYAALKLLGVIRVSNEDLTHGYGPAIQESEFIIDAPANSYQLIDIRVVIEPATIDLEERTLFQKVLAEAIELKKLGRCDGLSFSRVDRLSRKFSTALEIALECRKHGLILRFVRENQWLRPDDEPIHLVMFILHVLGVDTKTKVDRESLKQGQHKAAEAGRLPAGVGPGFLGYTLLNKHFEPNSFITVCDEVLERGYRAETINQITRDLQGRGIRTPSGKLLTRSTIAQILRKARRYAGIWDWGKHEIKGLIPPRITIEKAETILANLRRNREKSYGFKKRKWLTGRVICGLCKTRKYSLQIKRYCHCTRSEPLEANPPCPNARIRWQKLSERVWILLMSNLMNLDVLLLAVVAKQRDWESKRIGIERQLQEIEVLADKLHQQRRLFSWQHAQGVISDKELLDTTKDIQARAGLLEKQLNNLQQFLKEPAPPDPAKIKEWMRWWPAAIAVNYETASDDVKEKLAEALGLTVTVFPADSPSPDSYRLQLTANIPLDTEGIIETPNKLQMVFTPPQRQSGQRC